MHKLKVQMKSPAFFGIPHSRDKIPMSKVKYDATKSLPAEAGFCRVKGPNLPNATMRKQDFAKFKKVFSYWLLVVGF